jgi:hypothetical protein
MPLKRPTREEYKVVGDKVTHTPTGKSYEADPDSAEVTSENAIDVADYSELEIREIATQILAERLRITKQLR